MSHRPGLKQCSRAGPLAHCSSASSVILATLGRAWPKNSTTANADIITRARVRQHERPQPPAAAGVAPQQFNVQVVWGQRPVCSRQVRVALLTCETCTSQQSRALVVFSFQPSTARVRLHTAKQPQSMTAWQVQDFSVHVLRVQSIRSVAGDPQSPTPCQ